MCMSCKFETWLEDIDELLDDPDYEFAMDTLCGIQGWVNDHNHITPGQMIAIENIRNSKRDE